MKSKTKNITSNKKFIIKLASSLFLFFVIVSISLFSYKKILKQKARNTYLNSLSKELFLQKFKTAPIWMTDQIESDFKDFSNITISQDALKKNLFNYPR